MFLLANIPQSSFSSRMTKWKCLGRTSEVRAGLVDAEEQSVQTSAFSSVDGYKLNLVFRVAQE